MKILIIICFCALTLNVNAQRNQPYQLDQVYQLRLNGNISLNLGNAKVEITGSNRSDVKVKIDHVVKTGGVVFWDKDFSVSVNEVAGDLSLEDSSKSGSICLLGYYSVEYTAEIEIPMNSNLYVIGHKENYSVKNVNGAISFKAN